MVDDHTILLLEIPIGENKPYAHKLKNAIYVRRGASNVFPDPDSELLNFMNPFVKRIYPQVIEHLYIIA